MALAPIILTSLESYGYNAGADLDVMLDLSGGDNDTIRICRGDTASFFIGENFDNIYWTDGTDEETFNAYTEGKYWVTASAQGCELSDTVVIVTIEPPKPDLGPDRLFCDGDTLNFSANKGHTYYQWENGSLAFIIHDVGRAGLVFKGFLLTVHHTAGNDHERIP